MTYHPDKHHRRSIRLPGYDYSQNGSYFITICTRNRECLFGKIADGIMPLNDAGQTVSEEWTKTAAIRNEIELDEWVVMPNHFHGILVVSHGRDAARCRDTARCGDTARRAPTGDCGYDGKNMMFNLACFRAGKRHPGCLGSSDRRPCYADS